MHVLITSCGEESQTDAFNDMANPTLDAKSSCAMRSTVSAFHICRPSLAQRSYRWRMPCLEKGHLLCRCLARTQ